MRARDLLGPWGEAAAAAYLRKKGFRIEAMNYRTGPGAAKKMKRMGKFGGMGGLGGFPGL